MRQLTLEEFNELLKKTTTIKPRFKREVKFNVSTAFIDEQGWNDRELIAIYDKSKNKGILLIQPYDTLYMVAFETGIAARDGNSGRTKAVICDFCYTWRRGGSGGLVTFYSDSHSHDSTSHLCCFDLECSDHVRTKTKDALLSRAQLREHMTNEDRVVRLRERLQAVIDKMHLEPIQDDAPPLVH